MSAEEDIKSVIEYIYEFFNHGLPLLFIGSAVLVFFGFLTFVLASVTGWSFRQCGAAWNWQRLAIYITWIVVSLFGVAAVLKFVGISFADLAFTYGLLAIFFSAGFSAAVANAVEGMLMQTDTTFEPGHVVSVGDVKGKIVHMNLRHVIIDPNYEKSNSKTETDLIIIPNQMFATNPVKRFYQQKKPVPSTSFPVTTGGRFPHMIGGRSREEILRIATDLELGSNQHSKHI